MSRLKLFLALCWTLALSIADPALAATAGGPLSTRPRSAMPPESIAPVGPAAIAGRGDWTQIAPSGPLPTPRRETCAIYDESHDRMIVFGGLSSGDITRNDTWVLDFGALPAWSQLQTVNSPARASAAAIYDPVRKRMLIFGGHDGSAFRNDLLSLALDGSPVWQQVQTAGAPPTPRNFCTAVYDASRDRMLVFGGWNGSSALNDVWALSLGGTPTWEQVLPNGPTPIGRYGAVGVYDAANDRLIAAGGVGASDNSWALSLSGTPMWTELTMGAGPNQSLAAGIYDPGTPSLVLNGGSGNSDTWELALDGPPGWSQILSGTGAPPARRLHVAVYRDAVPEMVIFGGFTDQAGFFNDTWALRLIAQPRITVFAPLAGPVGTLVTIHGFDFSSATSVTFGGVEAVFTVQDPHTITATVPAGAATGSISVTTPDGTALSPTEFFVGETPEIATVSPSSGKVGTTVILSGRHFTGATRVAFDPASHACFTINSDLQITAVVDAAASTGPVSVTTPAGTGSASFIVVPPDTAARIVSVRDVPADQGGLVTVRWLGSDLDASPHREITGYRVWRRAPVGAASSRLGRAARTEWLAVSVGGEITFWEPLATIPAAYLQGYAYLTATSRDSMADGNPFTAFFIQALTADPFVFYNAAADSGYSVDNLAPAAPSPFVGTYLAGTAALQWGLSTAQDFAQFRLYRGDSSGFTPGPGNLVVAQATPAYVDHAGGPAWYRLSAVDVHGNESPTALLLPSGAVGVDGGAAAHGLWLAPLTPNPAIDGRLRLKFSLRDGSLARLELADVAGRVLRSIQVGGLGPGSHSLDLADDAGLQPGVYFLRLTQGASEVRGRAVVIR